MVIDFGEGMEFEATFNGFTPIVFSRTFNVEKPNGATRPKDINEDVGMIVETMKSYGMPSMTALLEIAYACIKTAKQRWGLGFDKWVKSLPPAAFDLQKGDGWARPPKQPAPPLPSNLSDACDARYLYNCQQCGLSITDLQQLSFRQVKDLLEIHAFYADAVANYEDDEKARKAEAAFWG